MMKIAIINKHVQDTLGGSEIQCDLIANGLLGKGHEVIYIAPDGKSETYKSLYNVVPVSNESSHIADTVLQQKPDIVYWRFNRNCLFRSARRIAKHHIPIIFAISHINDTLPWAAKPQGKRGIKPAIRSLKQRLINRINWEGYRHVQAATSLNPDYVGKLPLSDAKQVFVPNCMDKAIGAFSWPKPFVAWVSNIKTAKQPDVFYELSNHLRETGVDFIMIGNIQSKTYAWLREAHLHRDNFFYLGPKSLQEVNSVLAQSLFMIHTCQPEGFGNNFLQAWLQQKPTVSYAFDPGGFISKHQLGRVSGNDFKQLIVDVNFFINNEKEREAAGERAWHFANENFSIERTVQDIENLMQDTVSKAVKASELHE